MNCVIIWTHKSSIHKSLKAQLVFHSFRIAFNQGEVSTCFIDVNLIALQTFGRIEEISLEFFQVHFNTETAGNFGNEIHLNQVSFVTVGENSVHAICHFFPCSGYWKGVKAITAGVQTHVDRT